MEEPAILAVWRQMVTESFIALLKSPEKLKFGSCYEEDDLFRIGLPKNANGKITACAHKLWLLKCRTTRTFGGGGTIEQSEESSILN